MAALAPVTGRSAPRLGARFQPPVGNRDIMYFVETVLRDVCAGAGGSPFYIPKPVKGRFVKQAPIERCDGAFGQQESLLKRSPCNPIRNEQEP